ncbi:hypothetical protein ACVGW8_20350, partial [Enterobacter hormaechei]
VSVKRGRGGGAPPNQHFLKKPPIKQKTTIPHHPKPKPYRLTLKRLFLSIIKKNNPTTPKKTKPNPASLF